ncbi:NADH:flavin oxidoreductase/NADH oxidase [Coniochaeta sp. 2T2.1]|nr:NADH:flavin oxidoreductase/NADH oxidase [Coniochaeta sp. 2T2.1]
MTRNRGVPLFVGTSMSPNTVWYSDALVATYYSQRASPGGLLITEGIPPSLQASGMPFVPGLFHSSQTAGWKLVVDAVHAKGGYIYAQLWHAGRATLPHFNGGRVMSSAATPWDDGEKFPFRTPAGEKVAYRDFPPEEMGREDIERTIRDFVEAARRAVEEVVLDQFLHSNINTRTDEYGGSPENRCQFPLELIAAVVDTVGASNVGVRLEPTGLYNHTRGAERVETWSYLCPLKKRYSGPDGRDRLSYVHFIEPRFDRIESEKEREGFYASWSLGRDQVSNEPFRKIFDVTEADGGDKIPCFSCGGWDGENWKGVVGEEGKGWDALVFAKWFASNPDLPERLRRGVALHAYDRSRFYGAWDGVREKGYTDYPTYEEEEKKKSEAA